MESKASQEAVKSAVDSLDRKRAELLASRKIDMDTFVAIGELTQETHRLWKRDKLDIRLGELVTTANVLSVAPFYALDEVIRGRQWLDLLEVLKDLGFTLNTLFEKPLPAVSIGTEKDPEARSKPIDNMLFSYTPFKLRGTAGNYSMLLLPSARGHTVTTRWCDDDSRTFYEGDVKILTPNSIKLTTVNNLKDTVSITGERGFRLEVDRRSPENTYYCKMGLYVSPVNRCQRRECYLWDPCQGKKFWRGPTSFYSLSKVSPDLAVKIDRYDSPIPIQSNKFGLAIETIPSLQAKLFIDSVIFYSSYFTHSPMIKLKETPGYQITTRAVGFSVEASWIETFVRTVLSNDPEIFAWVLTKHFVSTNYDVNDLRRVSTFFSNTVRGTKDAKVSDYEKLMKSRNVTPELVSFGVALLMHGLAHLIHEEVISTLQTSSENLVYSFSDRAESDGKYRVFIIENAEKGLGLTQSFAASVAKIGPKYLDDLASRINKLVAMCSRHGLFVPPTRASSDVKLIWNQVNAYHRTFQLRFGISMPVEFVRYVLSRDAKTSSIIDKDEVSPYIDDILSSTPLCWDGCYHCVRLESDCHYSPFEQIFGVSKSLVVAFLNEWLGVFKSDLISGSKSGTKVQIGEARNLLNYVRGAKREVAIISPWFSKQVAKTICDLSKAQGVKFKIITSNDEQNETHLEALRIFQSQGDEQIDLRVLIDRLPHIKMIIIDDSLLIMGSANLTLSGLYENVEGYVIISDSDNIVKSLRSFDELWNQGKEPTSQTDNIC